MQSEHKNDLNTFMLMYQSFTTPQLFFLKLVERYNMPSHKNDLYFLYAEEEQKYKHTIKVPLIMVET